MRSGRYRFGEFLLDMGERRLSRGGAPVELSARYLDALTLLVGEAGRLIGKDRFLDEVWRGVPVTDEALTQCIKMLRRQLGDDAASPRFIETVPKHGYRFVAAVERVTDEAAPMAGIAAPSRWRRLVLLGGAGTIGAGAAGLAGGLIYGFAGASHPLAPAMGGASVLLVILWLTIAAALMGGAGVSFGIAAAGVARGPGSAWGIVGGASGGLAVGAVVKTLGLDAFHLLLGRAPGGITGAAEGLALGGAVGFGAWLAGSARSLRRGIALAGLAGGMSGLLIALLGGRLMAGSLDLLAREFSGSRLRLERIGALFGESGFGPLSQAATGALEGALFAACIAGAMLLAARSADSRSGARTTSGRPFSTT